MVDRKLLTLARERRCGAPLALVDTDDMGQLPLSAGLAGRPV